MLFPYSVIHLIPTNGCDRNLAGTSKKGTEYHLHLIKIPSHIRVESSYTAWLKILLVHFASDWLSTSLIKILEIPEQWIHSHSTIILYYYTLNLAQIH